MYFFRTEAAFFIYAEIFLTGIAHRAARLRVRRIKLEYR